MIHVYIMLDFQNENEKVNIAQIKIIYRPVTDARTTSFENGLLPLEKL